MINNISVICSRVYRINNIVCLGRAAAGRPVTPRPCCARSPRTARRPRIATKLNPLLPHAVPEGKGVVYS